MRGDPHEIRNAQMAANLGTDAIKKQVVVIQNNRLEISKDGIFV